MSSTLHVPELTCVSSTNHHSRRYLSKGKGYCYADPLVIVPARTFAKKLTSKAQIIETHSCELHPLHSIFAFSRATSPRGQPASQPASQSTPESRNVLPMVAAFFFPFS